MWSTWKYTSEFKYDGFYTEAIPLSVNIILSTWVPDQKASSDSLFQCSSLFRNSLLISSLHFQ